MSETTISSISISDTNIIKNILNLDKMNETSLRIVHSILDQQKQNVIDRLNDIETKSLNEDVNSVLDSLDI